MSNTENSNAICLWCGKNTSENTDREHIFPEGIGGKEKLDKQFVCKTCNHELGYLDEALKRGHTAMMDAFQVDRNIKGKNRGKEDRERKEKEYKFVS